MNAMDNSITKKQFSTLALIGLAILVLFAVEKIKIKFKLKGFRFMV